MCATSNRDERRDDNRWSADDGADSVDSVGTTESLAILRGLYFEYRPDLEKAAVRGQQAPLRVGVLPIEEPVSVE